MGHSLIATIINPRVLKSLAKTPEHQEIPLDLDLDLVAFKKLSTGAEVDQGVDSSKHQVGPKYQ